MNRLIVIEGLDGSGKATQAKLLSEALAGQGLAVREVSFPDYESPSSTLVKMYLAGEFGEKPSDVNAYAASTFYAVDLYASFMKDWRQDYAGGVVIADRYTTSNAIHQCSKLGDGEWDGFLQWLFDLEYRKMGIPRPDLVVYLRVDPDVSQTLMLSRYDGDGERRDIHEKDLEYQRRCQSAADYCARRLGWAVVECCANGRMRSRDAIHGEIMRLVGRLDGRSQRAAADPGHL